MTKANYIVMIALIVALGGLLMGFDASVISGVIKLSNRNSTFPRWK